MRCDLGEVQQEQEQISSGMKLEFGKDQIQSALHAVAFVFREAVSHAVSSEGLRQQLILHSGQSASYFFFFVIGNVPDLMLCCGSVDFSDAVANALVSAWDSNSKDGVLLPAAGAEEEMKDDHGETESVQSPSPIMWNRCDLFFILFNYYQFIITVSSISCSARTQQQQSGMKLGRLVKLDWKLGVRVSSSQCQSLNTPYVALTMHIADSDGKVRAIPLQLSLEEFRSLGGAFQDVVTQLDQI